MAAVAAMMERIAAEEAELDGQLAGMRRHGGALPPEEASAAVEEGLDAVGVLFCAVHSLRGQIAAARAKWAQLDDTRAANLPPMLVRLRAREAALVRCLEVVRGWGLPLPPAASVAHVDLDAAPLASTDPQLDEDSGPPLQRLLGRAVLDFSAEQVAGGAVPPAVAPLLEAYNHRRTLATAAVVPIILDDVRAYAAALRPELEAAGAAEALGALRQMKGEVPQPLPDAAGADSAALPTVLRSLSEVESGSAPAELSPGALSMARAQQLVDEGLGADAPPDTQPGYAIHARKRGARASVALYELLCAAVAEMPGDPLVMPGGIKKLRRMCFKALTNYGGRISDVRDVARATIKVDRLAAVAAVARALLDTPELRVLRIKNRFDAGYDADPIGGYRDLQFLACFCDPLTSLWSWGEVQVNLLGMVEIKGRKGGGHAVFKYARSLEAYNAVTWRFEGDLTAEVASQVAAGMQSELGLSNAIKTPEAVSRLSAALLSTKCRVNRLNLCAASIPPQLPPRAP